MPADKPPSPSDGSGSGWTSTRDIKHNGVGFLLMSSGHGRSTHIAALSPALEQASFMIYRMVVCDAQPASDARPCLASLAVIS